MKLPGKVLVVGADGAIGAALVSALCHGGTDVLGTTRRPDSGGFHLDMAQPLEMALLPNAQTVFLCAGINGFAACDAAPILATRVNVEATLAIGTHYLQRGAHVTFLSSTAVFGTRSDLPDESTTVSPDTTYGALKCASEVALQAFARHAPGLCTIVRLTKVLSAETPLLQKWRKGATIDAFTDSTVCPVSLSFVVRGLMQIAQSRVAGCFHLTGAQTVSYAGLAQALVRQGRLANAVVREISQGSGESSGVQTPCVSLTMPQTSQKLGIHAQTLEDCLKDL